MKTLLQSTKNSWAADGLLFRKYLLLTLFLSMVSGFVWSQNLITVTGKVTSGDDGNALPGVTVILEGTSTGTISDLNGDFSIEAPANGVLQFSFIGYETQVVPVNSRSTIHIELVSDAQSLDEFVVTGYSTQQRKNITGSVAVVDTDNLKKIPARSAQEALQGMASGVNVTKSGVPGAGGKI